MYVHSLRTQFSRWNLYEKSGMLFPHLVLEFPCRFFSRMVPLLDFDHFDRLDGHDRPWLEFDCFDAPSYRCFVKGRTFTYSGEGRWMAGDSAAKRVRESAGGDGRGRGEYDDEMAKGYAA